jgi:hypothetical protein
VRARTSITLGAGSGLVGLVLMIVEAVRVLNGSTLTTLNSVVLFVGLGLLAVGGVLLVMAVVAEDNAAALAIDGDQPATPSEDDQDKATEETTADEPASPAN